MIFFSELGLTRLEFKFLLGKVLLLCDESLLILIHLAALIQQPGGRGCKDLIGKR